MGIEENKRMAMDLVLASGAHDGKRFDELLHPEATYWVIGKPDLFGYAGEQSRAEIVAFMSSPSIFINGGAKPTFGAITAEDDRVALEAETRGEMADGRVYTNVYHYLMWFRDGKIIRVKEYLDTQSAVEFFNR